MDAVFLLITAPFSGEPRVNVLLLDRALDAQGAAR
jgi:hypothetical protein